jgi:hypothetical protein
VYRTCPLRRRLPSEQSCTVSGQPAQLPEGSQELCAIYRSELSKRKALLVLDNSKDATRVRNLLPPAPSVAIVTSRRAILLPGLQSLSLEKLEPPAALALLAEIIGSGPACCRIVPSNKPGLVGAGLHLTSANELQSSRDQTIRIWTFMRCAASAPTNYKMKSRRCRKLGVT